MDIREIDGVTYVDGYTKKNYDCLFTSWIAYQNVIYDLDTALMTFFSPERVFTRSIVSQIRLLEKIDSPLNKQRLEIVKARAKINRDDNQARMLMKSVFDLETTLLTHSKGELPDWRKIVPNYKELIQVDIKYEPSNRDVLSKRCYQAFLDGKISKEDCEKFLQRKDMNGAKYR